eukprot:11175029-Lingulodinium_polyedra.AAC.1
MASVPTSSREGCREFIGAQGGSDGVRRANGCDGISRAAPPGPRRRAPRLFVLIFAFARAANAGGA